MFASFFLNAKLVEIMDKLNKMIFAKKFSF